jgi:hypothetical protein
LTVPPFVPTASVADRLPLAPGVNVYCSVHVWPLASAVLTAQLPPRVKSPGFVPPAVNEATVSVPPPRFVKVTLFAALVFPILSLPKLSDDELSFATAAVAVAATAASVTTKVAPPTVRFALRCAPVLAPADQLTVVLPLPLDPEDTVSQFAPLPMLHAQPVPAVSVKLPVPPSAPRFALVGLSVYVHPLAWLTVKA